MEKIQNCWNWFKVDLNFKIDWNERKMLTTTWKLSHALIMHNADYSPYWYKILGELSATKEC